MKLTVLSTKVPREFADLVHKTAKEEGLTASSWLYKLAKKELSEA